MIWRNLYLELDTVLSRLLRKNSLKHTINFDGQVWIYSTENKYWFVIDDYYKKKGIVLKEHRTLVA